MARWKYSLSSADSAPNTAPILLTGDVCANLKRAAQLGYSGIEIHCREDAVFNYKAIGELCEENGIEIAALATGRLNTQGKVDLMNDNKEITDSAKKGMLGYIKMAAKLKTNVVIGWVKGRIPDGADSGSYLERFARNLTVLCNQAAGEGVQIFTEVINRYETNVLVTAQEAVDFLDYWKIPNCFIHLDTFHMNIEEINPCDAIKLCKDRLGYFHVADNTRMYPGRGTLDFKGYFSALKEISYGGFVSVECLPKPDGETAAIKALAQLKSCE